MLDRVALRGPDGDAVVVAGLMKLCTSASPRLPVTRSVNENRSSTIEFVDSPVAPDGNATSTSNRSSTPGLRCTAVALVTDGAPKRRMRCMP